MDSLLAWLDALGRRRAESVRVVPGGFALRHPGYPDAHDHNRVVIDSPLPVEQLPAELILRSAELGLGDARHRLISISRPTLELADAVAPSLIAAGYGRSDNLFMMLPRVPAPGTALVEELPLAERVAIAEAEWQADQTADVAGQLGERIRTVLPAADVSFLGIRDEGGAVVAHVDLYRRDGIAQIEELMTAPAARGRGYGSALIAEAGRRAGADTAFLMADAADWPQHLYRRLGFVDVGRAASFTRLAPDE